MAMLVAGVLLWTVVHLIPGPGREFRQKVIAITGAGQYRGIFSLLLVAALLLIVFGWRSTMPRVVYQPPAWGHATALVLMPVSVFLFGAARAKTRIKRLIRHPQLSGVILWSLAHLLANGDDRSLLLFGGLGLWASLEIAVINRRDREWIKPAAPSLAVEFRGLVITVAVVAILLYLHPIFAGVAVVAL